MAASAARKDKPRDQPRLVAPADDTATTMTMRVRLSSLSALQAEARARGLTVKQVMFYALSSIGVAVAVADLQDGTPRRKPLVPKGKSGNSTR